MRACARCALRAPPQLQFFGFTVASVVSAAPEPPPGARIDGVALDATRLPGVLLAALHAALLFALLATDSALWEQAREEERSHPRVVPIAALPADDDAASAAHAAPTGDAAGADSLTQPLLAAAAARGEAEAEAAQLAALPARPEAEARLALREASRLAWLAIAFCAINLCLRFTLAIMETLGARAGARNRLLCPATPPDACFPLGALSWRSCCAALPQALACSTTCGTRTTGALQAPAPAPRPAAAAAAAAPPRTPRSSPQRRCGSQWARWAC